MKENKQFENDLQSGTTYIIMEPDVAFRYWKVRK